MKKSIIITVLLLLLVTLVITSGTGEPNISKMNSSEMKNWRNSNDTIFFNNKEVAIFEHYEYELNPSHHRSLIQTELCLIQIDDNPDNTMNLIRYIHTIHPSSKIQIEFKDQYDRIGIWKKRME